MKNREGGSYGVKVDYELNKLFAQYMTSIARHTYTLPQFPTVMGASPSCGYRTLESLISWNEVTSSK